MKNEFLLNLIKLIAKKQCIIFKFILKHVLLGAPIQLHEGLNKYMMRPKRMMHHSMHHIEWALKLEWTLNDNEQTRGSKIDLLKGQVGPPAFNSKVRVLERIWACSSRVKFVHLKYENSLNLVSIEHWTNAPCLTFHQSIVYPRRIENVLKCIIGGDMVLALHHPWALCPKQDILWHIRVSQ